MEHSGDFSRVTLSKRRILLSRLTAPPIQVVVSVFDDVLIFEGDIAVGRVAAVAFAPEGVAIIGTGFRWPNAEVPYTIESGNEQRIQTAITVSPRWELEGISGR